MAILLRLALAALLLTLTAASTVNDDLSQYGLPRGLLPDSVKTYSLAPDGSFSIELADPCYVEFSDLFFYEPHIKGKLASGSISDLSGIYVKKHLILVPITRIVAKPKEGMVEFEAAFISVTLPAEQFEDIHKCKDMAACRGAAGIVLPVAEV